MTTLQFVKDIHDLIALQNVLVYDCQIINSKKDFLLTLNFTNELSVHEIDQVTNVINNFSNPDLPEHDTHQIINTAKITSSLLTFNIMSTFFYQGTRVCPVLKQVVINSRVYGLLSGSYTIRIYDTTNSVVLGEQVFTNETFAKNIIPMDQTLLSESPGFIEVQFKKGDLGDYIEANYISFVY